MTSALRVLIFFGLIIWGFFLAEQYMPHIAPQISAYFKESDSERCQQFGRIEEDVKVLSYRDRVKQVVVGCW